MPRFSIIVPTYQVQAYLDACLTSVLSQEVRDLELIVVDDASPDACGEIAAECAAADSRVLPLRLTRNAGPGVARNAALDHATGDYVLFLDGDDTLTPGVLADVAARLDRTGHPELLVFDHAHVPWHGPATPGALPGLLGEGSPEVFSLTERPQLLWLPHAAWNKAYRRDFIARAGLRFPSGYYEDVAFTYPALLAAESVAVLDRVCVHHRQRRHGGRLRTAGDGHFDVLTQYERVFQQLDRQPDDRRLRAALYRRMVDHLTTVYHAPGRLPVDSRAEFFRRSSALCRRYRTAAGATALGARPRASGLRHLLLRLGARRAFQTTWRVHRVGRRLRATAWSAARLLRAALLRLHYRVHLRRPLDRHLAVFTNGRHSGYAGHPAAIEARLRELVPRIRTAWVAGPEHAASLPTGVRRLQPDTRPYWTAMARARFLVSGAGFPDALVQRRGQVRLQTHQGTPLAHQGLDLRTHPATAADLDVPRLLRQIDSWDYNLSANRHSTLAWETAYPASFTTLEYGSPRADIFHTATLADVLRVRAGLGIPDGALSVLYAPADREYEGGAGGSSGLSPLPHIDVDGLARALGPGVVLLVRRPRGHRPPRPRTITAPGVLDVTGHPCLEELCLAADVLVTDYAPVMFDYANLDRPIVIHADDWETYRAIRGTYLDLLAAPPGPVTRTEGELLALLACGRLWTDPGLAALRAAFRRRFCPYDDGLAAERVVRQVFLDGRHVPPVVPIECRLPAPSALAQRPVTPRPRSGQGPVALRHGHVS